MLSRSENKRADRSRSPAFRSSITTGKRLLADVDGRSTWARRFRDLIELHANDKGGEGNISEAERALIRRAACLIVELERLESRFANNEGASPRQLLQYGRHVNTLRRLLEALGLERRPRDITPPRNDMTGLVLEHIREVTA